MIPNNCEFFLPDRYEEKVDNEIQKSFLNRNDNHLYIYILPPRNPPKHSMCYNFYFNFNSFGNIKEKCVPVYDIEVSLVESLVFF